jgi:hypothetical protein
MKDFGDLRNKLSLELARASGGFVSQVPPEWWGDPDVWAEAKRDDVRVSLQMDVTRNWAISRNRQNKLRGVDKAGPFVDKSRYLPHLCARLERPKLAGLMLDGGVSDRLSVCGGRGASVGSLMVSDPERLIYTAWDVILDVGGVDVRHLPQRARRELLEQRVAEIGSSHVVVAEKLPATLEEVKRLAAEGWEGAVLKRGSGRYRETHAWYKAKAENPVAAIIIGYTPEKRGGSPKKGIKPQETGRIGGFLVAMKSIETQKLVKVGWLFIGLPDEIKDRGVQNFSEFKGKVVECTASGWSGQEFRWMKWVGWHQDQDYTPILEQEIATLPVVVGEEE